ncbi:hypothetical protein LTR70_010434 [Exophiala xenobiotica]|nr:hypothetical protein LTR70_010434 [Exophiala xenobiotica]
MGLPLEKHLYGQQTTQACRELGLPWPGTWGKDDIVKIKNRLRSPDPGTLQDAQDLQVSFKDCIVVRAVLTESKFWIPGALASMKQRDNVMTLYSCFFADEKLVDSLRDNYIEPGMTDIRSLVDNRTLTVLHEVGHSLSSIAAGDHIVEYNEGDWKEKGWQYMVEIKTDTEVKATESKFTTEAQQRETPPIDHQPPKKRIRAQGFEACLDLAEPDNEDGTNKADDNAETNALYALQRQLILAYTDLDVSVGYRDWTITPRKQLLHHCSFYHCMRQKDAGSIRDHPDYDPQKDSWGKQTGKKLPSCVKELLDDVVGIVPTRLEEDEAKTANARRREEPEKKTEGQTI